MGDIELNPYYQDEWVAQYCTDALMLAELEAESVDLLCTDPPYGISFMGKEWDKALPDIRVWQECLRVLKPGSFAFVMSIPRADCLSRMIISLEDAGFQVNFTPIFWAYASGFPKAQNIGKAVDKRLGTKREVVGYGQRGRNLTRPNGHTGDMAIDELHQEPISPAITSASSPQAKALDGSYGGFQPKPAVEVIIVAMKPLSEKTFVDQALKNRKGITWLDDGRIPYESDGDKEGARFGTQMDIRGSNLKTPQGIHGKNVLSSSTGRFPANLLVSDDVLNDGRNYKKGGSIRSAGQRNNQVYGEDKRPRGDWDSYGDSGSFSRYFDLDKWWAKTFPFLIVPKASRSEKEKGLDDFPEQKCRGDYKNSSQFGLLEKIQNSPRPTAKNIHPTVKPLKLMSYLITLGSREGDIILDPYSGSGTTLLAGKLLNRRSIGIEIEEKYCEIAAKRCSQTVMRLGV